MNWKTISFDWNQARAFLATAEEGSLLAAARAIGQTQPTLSRQISALEEDLGVMLFKRGGRALTLTQSGIELLEHVRAMGQSASLVSLTASGQSQAIEGLVSITASEMVSTYILPQILLPLRESASNIEVEIISSNQVQDLTRREADIAIRHVRPEQLDLIAKRGCDISAHMYSSQAYLDSLPKPITTESLETADFLAFEQTEKSIAVLRKIGLEVSKQNFKSLTNSSTVNMELVKQGYGIGLLPDPVATLFPELIPVLPDLHSISGPVWLTTHQELRTSRRIRFVFDMLVDALLESQKRK